MGNTTPSTSYWYDECPGPSPTTKPGEQHRWVSDGQGGGEFEVYTPGVTKCWDCGKVIDSDGVCDDGDSCTINNDWWNR
jgi:hypothetical protein